MRTVKLDSVIVNTLPTGAGLAISGDFVVVCTVSRRDHKLGLDQAPRAAGRLHSW